MKRVLITGATGYIGGRLLRLLRENGIPVRLTSRRPAVLRARYGEHIDVVGADVLDPDSLRPALEGVDAAYYLVHTMVEGERFRRRDREGAQAFAAAAREAGVTRIIYLGGLGSGNDLSRHLASRHEVGRILREKGPPTLEFRASIVLGSGSLSFEIIRGLVERLPVMATPRWVSSRAQPIAIEDVLAYLLAGLELDLPRSRVVEIGGPDVVSYLELMQEYARRRGLRRRFIKVPLLTPRLSSLWLGLVTPVYSRVGRQLIEGVRNDTVVTDASARGLFPAIRPRPASEAIARALSNEDRSFAETRWSDALRERKASVAGTELGQRMVDSRVMKVDVEPAQAFRAIRRIGGRRGWYYADPLWRLRGFLDLLAGGVGKRRGRRDPEVPIVGDILDFWRVEAYEPDRLLRLRAEMRVPGRAWLQFEVDPGPCDRSSVIRQTAIFDPKGLGGRAYWYGLYPLHSLIFEGMLREIGRTAQTPP